MPEQCAHRAVHCRERRLHCCPSPTDGSGSAAATVAAAHGSARVGGLHVLPVRLNNPLRAEHDPRSTAAEVSPARPTWHHRPTTRPHGSRHESGVYFYFLFSLSLSICFVLERRGVGCGACHTARGKKHGRHLELLLLGVPGGPALGGGGGSLGLAVDPPPTTPTKYRGEMIEQVHIYFKEGRKGGVIVFIGEGRAALLRPGSSPTTAHRSLSRRLSAWGSLSQCSHLGRSLLG